MVSNEEQHSSELLIPLELDSSSRTQSVFELGGGEREVDKADLGCTAQDGGGSLTKLSTMHKAMTCQWIAMIHDADAKLT